jgi:hypothetical protein
MFAPILLFALFAHHQGVSQSEDRGGSLYKSCKIAVEFMGQTKPSLENAIDAEFCRGYLTAFVDVRSFRSANFCPPNEATVGTSARIYVLFMEKNPLYMDKPMRDGLLKALQEAYPCAATN